ncbi:MAG TPA: hypothetical protein VL240_10465 [Candidatus Binatia bacterium]|nr:hypothetical protein [Candidatus Binatia bacterium]
MPPGENVVACPYFMPESRFNGTWPFPQRLPLGAGWSGTCCAPGYEGVRPGDEELTSGCNMGYAAKCFRLPPDRQADAVRFALGEEREGVLHVLFVCERNYLPAGHGELCYDRARGRWLQTHDDPRIQRMAECYVLSQLERRNSSATTGNQS